jgi:hypothetical protein
MVRTAALALLLSTGLAMPAGAAEPSATPITAAAVTAVTALASSAEAPTTYSRIYRAPGTRSLVLPALYVSLSALQAYDVYSTLTALKHGAAEGNPLMQGVVGNPAAFVALKAGVTGASIYGAEKLWRQDKKVQAVLLMVASNGLMAYVAHNNARVLRSMR